MPKTKERNQAAMKTLKERMTDILNDTVEYYKSNPRGIVDDNCHYFKKAPDGKICMCAVGRYMIDPEKVTSIHWVIPVRELDELYSKNGGFDYLLKQEYRGIPLMFWDDLQEFHDENRFWFFEENECNRLTPEGEAFYGAILRNIKGSIYEDMYWPQPRKSQS